MHDSALIARFILLGYSCFVLSTVVNMKHFCLKALGCTAKPVPAIYDLDLPRVIEAVQHPAERPEISVAVTS